MSMIKEFAMKGNVVDLAVAVINHHQGGVPLIIA